MMRYEKGLAYDVRFIIYFMFWQQISVFHLQPLNFNHNKLLRRVFGCVPKVISSCSIISKHFSIRKQWKILPGTNLFGMWSVFSAPFVLNGCSDTSKWISTSVSYTIERQNVNAWWYSFQLFSIQVIGIAYASFTHISNDTNTIPWYIAIDLLA